MIQVGMQQDRVRSGLAMGSGPGDGGNNVIESDAAYVRRYQAGDREAAIELIERHEAAIRRLILGLWADRDEVEDLCQEVFLRLMENLPRLTPPDSLRPWLYRTAINLVRDRARKRRVRQWLRLVDWPGARPAVEETEAQAERQELIERLREAISRLRPAWREVVVLRDLLDLSPAESAEVLGLSSKTVNDRLYRARRELAARLGRS
jgi:RNA polymerase sigma-70 factor (ECF subfamily)